MISDLESFRRLPLKEFCARFPQADVSIRDVVRTLETNERDHLLAVMNSQRQIDEQIACLRERVRLLQNNSVEVRAKLDSCTKEVRENQAVMTETSGNQVNSIAAAIRRGGLGTGAEGEHEGSEGFSFGKQRGAVHLPLPIYVDALMDMQRRNKSLQSHHDGLAKSASAVLKEVERGSDGFELATSLMKAQAERYEQAKAEAIEIRSSVGELYKWTNRGEHNRG